MKKKARKPTRRNPEAHELAHNPLFRSKITKSVREAAAQTNQLNRRASTGADRNQISENRHKLIQALRSPW